MTAAELDVLLVAEALVTDVVDAAPMSLAWAMYLGSPVSASWLEYRPQTHLIGRSTEDEQLTLEGSGVERVDCRRGPTTDAAVGARQ